MEWDTTRNLMIEGDNLEVTKLLQKSYAGKVKLIYIDPPYNTGSDFVYPDDFRDTIQNYLEITGQAAGDGRRTGSNTESSGRFHTFWLNMMYPRLKLARALLREDGVIFISIDDIEVANLRKICDEIFGEENFVAQLIWEGAFKNDARQIGTNHEYVLVYARLRASLPTAWVVAKEGVEPVLREVARLRAEFGEDFDSASQALAAWYRASKATPSFAHRRFRYIDRIGVYKEDDPTAPGGRRFELINPGTGNVIPLRSNRGWGFDQAKFNEMVAEGRISFITESSIMVRRYLHETDTVTPQSVFYQPARSASERLDRLMQGSVFSFPKDELVIKQFVEMATQGTESDCIVLDFFAGSGTTGHAVMAQNLTDAVSRRYILVQLPEPLDPDNPGQRAAAEYCDRLGKRRTIAELTKERLRRAANKLRDENPMFAGDLGFRVFKLDSSNIRTWEPDPENIEHTLESSIEHLKMGRTEQDVLYELLLKLGLDLAVPIEMREIAGKTVHSVGVGTLLVCLADGIARDEAEPLALGIAAWHGELAPEGDSHAVFRDSAFADDVAKTNLTAILHQHGIEHVRSI